MGRASSMTIEKVTQAVEDDFPLPQLTQYQNIIGAPTSLKDLDAAAQTQLDDATGAITGLGDLAYQDLVDTLHINDGAVSNAKIAVDAIQGAVIAAGAITSTKIQDNAISTPKIQAGAITTSTIAAGAITSSTIQAGAITSSTIAAGAIVSGKIAAGAIDGITITGSLVRTSSSGTRVQMNSSANSIEIYSSGTLRAYGFDSGWLYYNPSGQSTASIYADTTTYGSRSLLITTSGSSTGSIYNATGTSGTYAIYNGTQIAAYFQQYSMVIAYPIQPLSSDLALGGSPYSWGELWLNSVGYVNSGGSSGFPFPVNSGWSSTRLGTGRYRVNHPYSTTEYAVNITPCASTAKVWAVESRNSTNFVVRIANTSFALEDNDFMFQLILC